MPDARQKHITINDHHIALLHDNIDNTRFTAYGAGWIDDAGNPDLTLALARAAGVVTKNCCANYDNEAKNRPGAEEKTLEDFFSAFTRRVNLELRRLLNAPPQKIVNCDKMPLGNPACRANLKDAVSAMKGRRINYMKFYE